MPICLSGGIGFACLMILMGILVGMFVLWSFSCLSAGIASLGGLA